MTELMKRYEEKMDLKKDSIKMQYVYDRFIEGFEEFAQEEYDALQSENALLKAQLTWRPVSEKPEKDGFYFIKCVFYNPNIGKIIHILPAEYANGEWQKILRLRVISWLPIPPAPEGEVK